MTQGSNLQEFGDVPVCIAIDKSGSTYGSTLMEEIAVVQSICSLISPSNESPVRLLPWCHTLQAPIELPKESWMLNSLTSGGGTNPSILYSETQSIQILRNCGVWFLLTDGKIEDTLVQEFAVSTAELGLHGTACIVVVFGSTTTGPPATCDVSVGVAAYAVAPDCLFLFHDTATKRVSIMQAKGCFKTLLVKTGSVPIQPVLNKYTTWADLPTINYTDLAKIKLAPPRNVAPDEMALQDGLVVKIQDLYLGKVDDRVVGEIVKNEDNLKSLVIAEMARGTGRDLQKWLDNQQIPIPELTEERPDTHGRAQELVMQLLNALQTSENQELLSPIRASLRKAHRDNLNAFSVITGDYLDEEAGYRRSITNIGTARRQSYRHRLSERAGDSIGYDYGEIPLTRHTENSTISYYQGDNFTETAVSKLNFTFLPGFRRTPGKQSSEFEGTCMLCEEHAVLTILTKSPPEMTTSNFPLKGTGAPLAFPLAMSSFAETDIISFFVCCDPCALYLVKNCASPLKEVVTGALPLTSVQENLQAWLDVVDVALKGRFRKSDLSTLLVAILDRKVLENRSLPPRAKPSDSALYENALIWAKMELSKFSEVPMTLSPSFKNRHPAKQSVFNRRDSNLWTIISDQTVMDPCDASNVDIAMLRYPVPGFMVLIRLMRDKGIPGEQLKTNMFQRLMYFLTENYFSSSTPNGVTSSKSLLQDLLSSKPAAETATEIAPQQENTPFHVKISTDKLVQYKLLDTNTLASFRTMDGFKHVEQDTQPAIAVYLYALSLKGSSHLSAVDCFNALKVHPSLGKVILKPFAISEGLAADLMLQI